MLSNSVRLVFGAHLILLVGYPPSSHLAPANAITGARNSDVEDVFSLSVSLAHYVPDRIESMLPDATAFPNISNPLAHPASPYISIPLALSIPWARPVFDHSIMAPVQGTLFGGPTYSWSIDMWSKFHCVDNHGDIEEIQHAVDLHQIVPLGNEVPSVSFPKHLRSLQLTKQCCRQLVWRQNSVWLLGRYTCLCSQITTQRFQASSWRNPTL